MNVIMAEIPSVDQKNILTLDADGNEVLVTLTPEVAQDEEYSEAAAGN